MLKNYVKIYYSDLVQYSDSFTVNDNGEFKIVIVSDIINSKCRKFYLKRAKEFFTPQKIEQIRDMCHPDSDNVNIEIQMFYGASITGDSLNNKEEISFWVHFRNDNWFAQEEFINDEDEKNSFFNADIKQEFDSYTKNCWNILLGCDFSPSDFKKPHKSVAKF